MDNWTSYDFAGGDAHIPTTPDIGYFRRGTPRLYIDIAAGLDAIGQVLIESLQGIIGLWRRCTHRIYIIPARINDSLYVYQWYGLRYTRAYACTQYLYINNYNKNKRYDMKDMIKRYDMTALQQQIYTTD